MSEVRFTWDPRKGASNRRKHGVSFEEAKTVFFDEHALFLEDADPSVGEERFVLLGLSSAVRVLVICHCVRAGAGEIRIISGRRAIKAEQKQYWERLGR